MTSVVTLRDVTFAYHSTPILKDVNITVEEGELLGVIGPNGGGKTTLLKLIMGFLQPQQGSIEILGTKPKAARKRIAYVPQNIQFDRLFPISVQELVLSGRLGRTPWFGRYASADKRAALLALKKVGMNNYRRRQFGKLSGGQRQRALIARALASEPALLLLDEPTANVDSQAEADIYELLQELRGTVTIMMVTHDLNTVITKVDRVLCVRGIAFALQPEEVCEHFAVGLYHTPLITTQDRKMTPPGGRKQR